VVAVQRPDGSQPQPLQMAAVDIVVPAFASDAAKLHIAAPVRKNIPALQTSPPRFVFQVLHRLSFIGRPACHGKYVQRLDGVNSLPPTYDFGKYVFLKRVLKEMKRNFMNIFLFLITKVNA